MGHGDHWGCLGDAKEMVSKYLPICGENGKLVASAMCPAILEDNGVVEDLMFQAQCYHEGGFGVQIITMERSGEMELASAFPRPFTGVDLLLTIDEIKPWDNGYEGVLCCSAEGYGPSVYFFDAMFFKNRGKYKVGDQRLFTLGALAYGIEKVKCEPIVMSDQKWLAKHAEFMEVEKDDNGLYKPMTIETEGMTAYLPVDFDNWPEDVGVQFPIESVEEFCFGGMSFQKLLGPFLAKDSELKFELSIGPGAKKAVGFAPKPGDNVFANCWMVGWLKEE